jgi:hypothetical protein
LCRICVGKNVLSFLAQKYAAQEVIGLICQS